MTLKGRLETCAGPGPRSLLCAALLAAPAARAAPFVPADDATVLETVPGAADPAARQLRALDRRLAAAPLDQPLALDVARRDIVQSRRLGDPRYLGHAEAALAPWPMSPTTPVKVLLLRAVILQSVHDFAGSIAALDRVLAADPADAQAWLTLASVHQVEADYPAALHDCGQFATHTLGLAPDTCSAAVMALTGHAPVALAALTASMTVNQAEARAEPELAEWSATLAAEIAERLADPTAEQRYRAALALDPDDPYLLAAWSDFLLDHDRPAEVIALLRTPERTRIDPLLLRLALAEQRTRAPTVDAHVADLAARFETSRLRGDTIHRREQARFELDLAHQPARALATAQANWSTQREPADALVLLQAARAANRPDAADPVRRWLERNHVEDHRLRQQGQGAALDPPRGEPLGSPSARGGVPT